MLQLTGKKIKLFFYLLLFILLSTQITRDQNVNKNSYMEVRYIQVFGLSKDDNTDISKRLNSLLFKNIFVINKNNFIEILKKNNLIESFTIKKFYPNLIRVDIKKTDFLGMTSQNNKKYYIGSNAKLIPVQSINYVNKDLPFIFGKVNYDDFVYLKKIIDKSEFVFEEIDSFYYFPSKRWDIKTKSGLLIKLPKQNMIESLKIAQIIQSKNEFKNDKIIDLRVSNHVVTLND